MLAHATRDVTQEFVLIFKLDAKHGVGEVFQNRPFHFNDIFLTQGILLCSVAMFGYRNLEIKKIGTLSFSIALGNGHCIGDWPTGPMAKIQPSFMQRIGSDACMLYILVFELWGSSNSKPNRGVD